jgi:hypothetical protein
MTKAGYAAAMKLVLLLPWLAACAAARPVAHAELPVEPTASHGFVFEVSVGDSPRKLRFELDTGAAKTYLDAKVAAELGLEPTGSTVVHGSGREPFRVDQVAHVALHVGALVSPDHTINLTDLSGLADHLDGFLGADFIARYVITIDYDRNRLSIAAPDGFAYQGSGAVLPIELRNGQAWVEGSVHVPGGAAETSRFLVDTGSGDAVDAPAIRRSTGAVRHITTGVGLGEGTAEGVIGHADYFQLGPFRLDGALTACCAPNPDLSHMIGGEVLSRFTIVLDYPRGRIILERGARFAEPFPDA